MNIKSLVIACLVLVITGCNGRLDSNMATFNASATQVAGSGGIVGTPLALLTPEPTAPRNLYDLTSSTSETLVHAWGQTYGLPTGAEFAIYASQQQLSDFVVQTLQLNGWQATVMRGDVTIGTGQLRLDLALEDTNGAYGQGTITFQPTIDELGHLKLNPQGAQFGTLQIPNGLTEALGDAVETALIGAKNDSLSKVTITSLSLENQTIRVIGKVR